jgi:hypothetical protein
LIFCSSQPEAEETTTLSDPDINTDPSYPNNSPPEPESSTKKSDLKGESDFILEPETSSRTTTISTTTIHSRINSRTRQTTLPTQSRHRGFSSESRLVKPRTRESFKINPHKGKRSFEIGYLGATLANSSADFDSQKTLMKLTLDNKQCFSMNENLVQVQKYLLEQQTVIELLTIRLFVLQKHDCPTE